MSPTTVMYQTPQAVNHQVSSAATPVGGSSSFHAERYMHRAGVGLGITQIVLGIISVSTGIVLVLLPESYKHGAGIWCGFLFIVTGALGILARRKNKGLVISYMVMCIISAVISWTVLIGFSWAEILMKKVDPRVPYKYQISFANDIRGWSVFLIFVAFTEGVIAVISSAICCHGVCCCSEPSSQGTVIYTVPNNAQNTGAYMVPGQQGFVYYPQQGPQVGGYNAQPMYVQGPLAYNIAQQQHQQQQQQWPQQQQPLQAQPMHAQSPIAYNTAQQEHQQQQQQQWPQQQPPQAQQQPVDGATGQLAGPLPQKQ